MHRVLLKGDSSAALTADRRKDVKRAITELEEVTRETDRLIGRNGHQHGPRAGFRGCTQPAGQRGGLASRMAAKFDPKAAPAPRKGSLAARAAEQFGTESQ